MKNWQQWLEKAKVWVENNKKMSIILLASFSLLVIVLIFVSSWHGEMEVGKTNLSKALVAKNTPISEIDFSQSEPIITIGLYFLDPAENRLVREDREVALSHSIQYRNHFGRILINELIRGSFEGFQTVLPVGLKLRHSFWSADGTLYLDFDRTLVDGLPHGSNAEILLVEAILRTVAVNIPEATRVQFIIEGQPVSELTGHMDFTKPFPLTSFM